MRKYIEINEEVLKSIMNGTYVQGSLHYNKQAKRIDFNHYKRKKRLKDKVIAILEHGWLKESPKRVKYYISLKKSIMHRGCVRLLYSRSAKKASTIDRAMKIIPSYKILPTTTATYTAPERVRFQNSLITS